MSYSSHLGEAFGAAVAKPIKLIFGRKAALSIFNPIASSVTATIINNFIPNNQRKPYVDKLIKQINNSEDWNPERHYKIAKFERLLRDKVKVSINTPAIYR